MAAVKPPPSRTEGELFAERPRRGVRVTTPSATDEATASTGPAAASRNNVVRIASVESYKKLSKIGEGAFGAVWKERRDLRTGEEVAIKSVDAGGEVLLREAALLAACHGNPTVVGLREVARCSETDDLYLVMDFVDRSLHDVLSKRRRRGRPFTESETRRVMAQLLSGAGTMHAHGVVHCDLKPGNVLVGEHDGRLKICDFGLAKSVAAPVLEDTHLEGTLRYMAPEVLLCEKDCGTPVDLWALGCVMAELVAGRPLFEEENEYKQLTNIIHLLGIPDDVSALPMGVSAPSQLRDTVPEKQLSQTGFDVLRDLLEFDPKDRPHRRGGAPDAVVCSER